MFKTKTLYLGTKTFLWCILEADRKAFFIFIFRKRRLSGSELLGKPVSEVLEWLFPLFDDLTQILCKRDHAATVFWFILSCWPRKEGGSQARQLIGQRLCGLTLLRGGLNCVEVSTLLSEQWLWALGSVFSAVLAFCMMGCAVPCVEFWFCGTR